MTDGSLNTFSITSVSFEHNVSGSNTLGKPIDETDINVFSKYMYMVRVITIRDDVYEQLADLKKKNGMSFSQAIELLLKEKNFKKVGLLDYAGVIGEDDLNRGELLKSKRWKSGNKDMFGH